MGDTKMAATLRSCVHVFRRLNININNLHNGPGVLFPTVHQRQQSSHSVSVPSSVVPQTSLSRPPWSELQHTDPEEINKQHAEVVQKVTAEDLILIENHLQAQCG